MEKGGKRERGDGVQRKRKSGVEKRGWEKMKE